MQLQTPSLGVLIRRRTTLGIRGLLTRVYEMRGSLYLPEHDHLIDRRNNVLALLRGPRFGILDGVYGAELIPGCNIVTVAGNTHLAQKACGESPTNAFTIHEQCSAGTPGTSANRSTFTVIASSQQVQTSGYPKTNDGDTDNTGAGATVRSTATSYSAASFNNGAITHGIITNVSPGASEPIYAGWAWSSSINKTSADTLKVFHNSTMLGV